MPDRIIRAAILTSDGVCSLSWAAEVFYRRLMSVVDDYGRYDGRISVLKSHCYPLQTDKVTDRDVGKWLAESSAAGLVTVYSVGGKPYLQVERFGQRIRSDSKWPGPELAEKPENVDSRSFVSNSLTDVSTPRPNAAVFVCVCEGACVCEGVCDISGNGGGEAKVLPDVAVAWNGIQGVTHVRQMTEARRKALRSRLASPEWAGAWQQAIAKVAASDFCTGKNDSGWRADFDWFLRPDTVTKITEGKYDNRIGSGKDLFGGVRGFLGGDNDEG